jgi:hypothetical protein
MDSATRWWSWCAANLVGPVRTDDELYAAAAGIERTTEGGLHEVTDRLAAGGHSELVRARQWLKGRAEWLKAEVLAVESVLAETRGALVAKEQAVLGKMFISASRLEAASRLCTRLASVYFRGITANTLYQQTAAPEKHQKLHSRLRVLVMRAVTLSRSVKDMLTQALLLSPQSVLGNGSLQVCASCLGQPDESGDGDTRSTAGSGLFASVAIAAGTVIGEYCGEILCAEDLARRFPAEVGRSESELADGSDCATRATEKQQQDDGERNSEHSDRKRRRLLAQPVKLRERQLRHTADYVMKVADDVYIDASSTDPTVTNFTRYINHAPCAARSLNRASTSNVGAFGCIGGDDVAECDDGVSDGHVIPSMSGSDISNTCDDSDAASDMEATMGEGRLHQHKEQLQARSQRRPRLVVFALRRIDAGEELLLDYGSEYWRGRPSPLIAEARKSRRAM